MVQQARLHHVPTNGAVIVNEQVRGSIVSQQGNVRFSQAASPPPPQQIVQRIYSPQPVAREEVRTRTVISQKNNSGLKKSNFANQINQSPGQVSYTSSTQQRSPQHQRQDSFTRETKTITTTSQIVPNQNGNSAPRFGFDQITTHEDEQMNMDTPAERRSFNAQSSERYTNSQVPEISELSSIGHQISHKNTKYMSEKPFSEIRGESINNSTVQFYNSYMNKDEDESQAEWQDYTQGHPNNSPGLKPRAIVESESKYGNSGERGNGGLYGGVQ